MWRKPNRPSRDISQSFNDGIVTVYSVSDTAKPGYKPVKETAFKVALRYEEQRLGIQRFYSGSQNQVKIERVIRCPAAGNVSTQDLAVTEDGKQYEIHLVQTVKDVYPPSVDITLAKTDQKYEVSHDLE